LDGLANSNEFNLLLGYFSSSAINLLSVGFATFISKGGKMKIYDPEERWAEPAPCSYCPYVWDDYWDGCPYVEGAGCNSWYAWISRNTPKSPCFIVRE
jgi:hypothetical protein